MMPHMNRLDIKNFTAAQLRRMRAAIPKFPNIPWDDGPEPLVRKYAFIIIDEPTKVSLKNNKTSRKFDLKEALTRLLEAIEDGGSVANSVFRVGVTKDDLDKLAINRERRRKFSDGDNDPLNITLRISRS
jgi:hypothetical protein